MQLPRADSLLFRLWRSDDVQLAMQLWGDAEVSALIDARSPLGHAQIRGKLNDWLRMQEEHGLAYWPIFLKSTQQFVGCCGVRPYRPRPDTLELGCHLCRAHWRKGIATQASLGVIDFAFSTLGVAALFAGHHPNNDRSKALLARLGFRYSHDELYEPTGLMHPSYLLTAVEHASH